MEERVVEKSSAIAYRHGNGEIQTAESAEEAIRRCVHLGKMALEEGGKEKANLLVELYAMGQEKIAEEVEKTDDIEIEEREEPEDIQDKITEAEEQLPENELDLKETKETDGEANIQEQEQLATSKNEVPVSKEVNDQTTAEKEQETAQPAGTRTDIAGATIDTKPAEASLSANTSSGPGIVDSSPVPEAKPKAKSASAKSPKKANKTTGQNTIKAGAKNADIGSVPAKKEVPARSKNPTRTKIETDKLGEPTVPPSSQESLPKIVRIPEESSTNNQPAEKGLNIEDEEPINTHAAAAKDRGKGFFQEALADSANESLDIQADEIYAGGIDSDSDTKRAEPLEEISFSVDLGEAPQGLMTDAVEGVSMVQTGEDFYQLNAEGLLANPTEQETVSAKAEELSVPVEEVEEVMVGLAERIEKFEDNEAEEVNGILDKIVLKVKEVHTGPEAREAMQQDTEIEAKKPEETAEELKELFIELFDFTETDYTPELIDSFVWLSINKGAFDLAKKSKNDEQVSSHDRGTHEVIKNLLLSVSSIKKTIHHYVGKSAVYLYMELAAA